MKTPRRSNTPLFVLLPLLEPAPGSLTSLLFSSPLGEVLPVTKRSSLVVLVRSSSHPAFTGTARRHTPNRRVPTHLFFLVFWLFHAARQLQTFIPLQLQRRRRRSCREADRKTQLPPGGVTIRGLLSLRYHFWGCVTLRQNGFLISRGKLIQSKRAMFPAADLFPP